MLSDSKDHTIQEVFEASRFAKHLRLVDHIRTDTQRGRLYEAVDIREEGAGKSRKTKCRTQRCRDFAVRVYDVHYSGETFGIDPYVLRQTQGMYLQHPNLLSFYDADMVFSEGCKDVVTVRCSKAYLLVLMELASGNLKHWLDVRQEQASLEDITRLAFNMLNGIAFLHHQGFVHRRLHPSNIMMVEQEAKGERDRLVAKIGDFQDMASYQHSALPLKDDHCPYTSPEILMGFDFYCPASDMWSFGILLFEMLMGAGHTPFADTNRDNRWFKSSQRKFVLSNIFQWLGTPSMEWRKKYMKTTDVPWDAEPNQSFMEGLSDFYPELSINHQNESILDLINQCLHIDPEQRISAFDALRHPMFYKCHQMENPLQQQPTYKQPITKAIIPRGPWSDIRYDILQHAIEDIQGGLMQYYPTLMALYIFDRCPALLLSNEKEEVDAEFIYSCFCAAYMIALKMLVDLPDPLPDLFDMTKGILCGASETNRVNILFLERTIVQKLRFHFAIEDITSMPVTMSIFKTLLHQPFNPYKTREKTRFT